jgi:lysophospholipase L1-like esterase
MTMTSLRTVRRVALAAGCTSLVLAASGLASATGAPAAHGKAHKQLPVVAGSRYLALGDSISFGYREPNAIPKPNYNKQKSLVGFPEDVAKNLDLKLANASCPGETTDSFMDTSAQSNFCENSFENGHRTPTSYRKSFPLHVKYKNDKQSQLAFAEGYLKKHPSTRLVTLMIGANDGFLCLKQTSDGCVSEFAKLQKHIKHNATKIFKGLRNKADYKGQLVVVTYYSTDYSNSLNNIESQGVSQAVIDAGKPYHVRVADGFGQLKKAARQAHGDTCKANLLTALSGADKGTCGVHPSVAGQALMAQAVERAIKK